jgi:FtsH-binding integral membrane protein
MKARNLWSSVGVLIATFIVAVLIARSTNEDGDANLVAVLVLFVGSLMSGLLAGRPEPTHALRNSARVVGATTLAFLVVSVVIRALRNEPLRIGNALVLFMVLTSLGVAGAAVAKRRATKTK